MDNKEQIAQEAAERIGTHTDIESSTAIILDAIERGIQAFFCEGTHTKSDVERAAQPQRSEGLAYGIDQYERPDDAASSDPQEWTVVSEDHMGTTAICDSSGFTVIAELSRITCKLIVNSHNAALKAEQSRTRHFEYQLQLRLDELAAEREKSRILGNMTDGFRNQIKEHQTEYDRLSKIIEKDSLNIVELEQQLLAAQAAIAKIKRLHSSYAMPIAMNQIWMVIRDIDLSALEAHDKELTDDAYDVGYISACKDEDERRKPLVDLLDRWLNWMGEDGDKLADDTVHALASVKEG